VVVGLLLRFALGRDARGSGGVDDFRCQLVLGAGQGFAVFGIAARAREQRFSLGAVPPLQVFDPAHVQARIGSESGAGVVRRLIAEGADRRNGLACSAPSGW